MSDFDNDWRRRRDQFDPDDDYHTFSDEEDEEPNRRRPIILISIAVLILVFAGVVFLAYRQGINQGTTGEPPILRADTTPDKVAPENPGGATVPHQDKTIYDHIGGDGAEQENVEHLLPRAEEPVEVKQAEAPATPDAIEAAPLSPPGEMTPQIPAEPGAPANIMPQAAQQTAAIPAPESAQLETASPPEPTPPVIATGTGDYMVQLAALRDEGAALATFKNLQAKFPAELGGFNSDIERADLAEKGIYYRLRAGPMDRAQAQAICASLSGQGQGCLVKTR